MTDRLSFSFEFLGGPQDSRVRGGGMVKLAEQKCKVSQAYDRVGKVYDCMAGPDFNPWCFHRPVGGMYRGQQGVCS